ncbi:MAG: C4-type zinc ribbon domain-containing protein [Syntrophales bacterium]|nr:C4-type zinc ribbon domain-containing protein [Syntrophales bacterium]
MKKPLVSLIELQRMESAADAIQTKKKNIPIRIGALEQEYKAVCDAVEVQRVQVDGLRKLRKEKDAQLQAGQESLKRTRERLFEVKTNKEYQSMLKEIEIFEGKNSRLEDEVISLLDESDHNEAALKSQERELKDRSRSYEEERRKLEEELDSLSAELADCDRKSAEIRKEISAEILRKYEKIKLIGRGLAVVAVWKEVCSGCHMKIPPQMYNDLQKTTALLTCPHCNRIMYWKNRNAADCRTASSTGA